MGNMDYCKFRNTYSDLGFCYDDMNNEELSPEEAQARKRLIELCVAIAEEYGQEVAEEEDD